MSLENLPAAAIEIAPQPFIAVRLDSPTAKGIFVRQYMAYPEVALKKLAEEVVQAILPNRGISPVLASSRFVDIPGTQVQLQYLGRGVLKINLCKKEITVSSFTCDHTQTVTTAFMAPILQVLKKEKGFVGFNIILPTA